MKRLITATLITASVLAGTAMPAAADREVAVCVDAGDSQGTPGNGTHSEKHGSSVWVDDSPGWKGHFGGVVGGLHYSRACYLPSNYEGQTYTQSVNRVYYRGTVSYQSGTSYNQCFASSIPWRTTSALQGWKVGSSWNPWTRCNWGTSRLRLDTLGKTEWVDTTIATSSARLYENKR